MNIDIVYLCHTMGAADTKMSEIPQDQPHGQRQATRVSGIDATDMLGDISARLNNLEVAFQRLPNDVASRILINRAKEKEVRLAS